MGTLVRTRATLIEDTAFVGLAGFDQQFDQTLNAVQVDKIFRVQQLGIGAADLIQYLSQVLHGLVFSRFCGGGLPLLVAWPNDRRLFQDDDRNTCLGRFDDIRTVRMICTGDVIDVRLYRGEHLPVAGKGLRDTVAGGKSLCILQFA